VSPQYGWYWPRRNDPAAPQLTKAWAYYEHVTLPRHFVGEGAADTVLRRAEPGEHMAETELYEPFNLKQSTLIEWGTGIDLYFILPDSSTSRVFSITLLIRMTGEMVKSCHCKGQLFVQTQNGSPVQTVRRMIGLETRRGTLEASTRSQVK